MRTDLRALLPPLRPANALTGAVHFYSELKKRMKQRENAKKKAEKVRLGRKTRPSHQLASRLSRAKS